MIGTASHWTPNWSTELVNSAKTTNAPSGFMDRASANPASLSSARPTRASPSQVTTARLRPTVAGPSYRCWHTGSVGNPRISSPKSSGFGPLTTQPCTPPKRSAANANATPRRLTLLAYPVVLAMPVIATTRADGATGIPRPADWIQTPAIAVETWVRRYRPASFSRCSWYAISTTGETSPMLSQPGAGRRSRTSMPRALAVS